jgi:SAM-dependent methyltransferase
VPAPSDAEPGSALPFGNAAAYERMMGRWSRRLAPLLIRFGGLSDGDRVLDVGCGTGSLSFALPQIAAVKSVTGVDVSAPYVDYLRAKNPDPRFAFERADARALPFPDAAFDRAFSMLVLQFIPDAALAVREMRRVVRRGGTVTAATWDGFSGLPQIKMMWDIAAALDPTVKRNPLHPLMLPQGLETLWREVGLVDVEQTSLLIRMDFESFDDYWLPLTAGEGPPGQFVAGRPEAARAILREHLRQSYLHDLPDGPRSFACIAWACRGTVPPQGPR